MWASSFCFSQASRMFAPPHHFSQQNFLVAETFEEVQVKNLNISRAVKHHRKKTWDLVLAPAHSTGGRMSISTQPR